MHHHDHDHGHCCDSCAQGKPCEGCDGKGGCGNAGCGCMQNNDACAMPTRDWQCAHPGPVSGGPSPRYATPPPKGIAWGHAGAPISPHQASALHNVLARHGYAGVQAGPTSRRRQLPPMTAMGSGHAGASVIERYIQVSENASRPNQFGIRAPRRTIRAAHARRGAKMAAGYQGGMAGGYQGGMAGAVRYAVKDHAKGRDIYKEVEGRWLYVGSSRKRGAKAIGNGIAHGATKHMQVGSGCFSGCFTGPASRQRWGGELRGRVRREYACDPCHDPRKPERPSQPDCPPCAPCATPEPCPVCPPGLLMDTMTGQCVPIPVCPECPQEEPKTPGRPEVPPQIDVVPPCCGIVFVDGRAFIECEEGSDIWGIPPEWHGQEVAFITSDTRNDGVKVVSVEAAFIPGGGARLPLCSGSEPPSRPAPQPKTPTAPPRRQLQQQLDPCVAQVLQMGYVPGTSEFEAMVARCRNAAKPSRPKAPASTRPTQVEAQVTPPQIGPTLRRPPRIRDRIAAQDTPTPSSGNGSPSNPPAPGGGSWGWEGSWEGSWKGGANVP